MTWTRDGGEKQKTRRSAVYGLWIWSEYIGQDNLRRKAKNKIDRGEQNETAETDFETDKFWCSSTLFPDFESDKETGSGNNNLNRVRNHFPHATSPEYHEHMQIDKVI